MHELCDLLLHRFDNSRVTMPKYIHSDTCDKVKVTFAFAIPDVCALTSNERDGLSLEGALIILFFQSDPVSLLCLYCHESLLLSFYSPYGANHAFAP